MRLNTDAAFDCISIARRVDGSSTSFAAAEIHLFAYLACMLWMFRRNTAADWGYEFVATQLGAPFSLDIEDALSRLTDSGCFVRTEERFLLSELAADQFEVFTRLTVNRDRVECLDAACATTAAFSLGMVSNALSSQPELNRATELRISRRLLQEAGRSHLHEQFQALRQCLTARTDDLRLPAVVWITALYRAMQSAQN
jgi:hypothetical protein